MIKVIYDKAQQSCKDKQVRENVCRKIEEELNFVESQEKAIFYLLKERYNHKSFLQLF